MTQIKTFEQFQSKAVNAVNTYGLNYRVNLKENPAIAALVKKCDAAAARKHHANVSQFNGVQINSYWDGGSRSYFHLVHIPTGQVRTGARSHPFYEVAREGIAGMSQGPISVDHVGNVTLHALPPDCCLVETGVFCGKTATAHVYLPSQLEISEPAVELIEAKAGV